MHYDSPLVIVFGSILTESRLRKLKPGIESKGG